MGRIFQEIEIIGSIGKKKVMALFDSGASKTFILQKVANEVEPAHKLSLPINVSLGDGKTKLRIEEMVSLEMIIDGHRIDDVAYVSEKLSCDLIIGAQTMQLWNIKLDLKKESLITEEILDHLELV
jgi:hypothetical protein